MSVVGGEREEVDVPGDMPPLAQALLPLFRFGGWIAGSGGNRNPEKVSQSPGHQVAETLLEDVLVRALIWEY